MASSRFGLRPDKAPRVAAAAALAVACWAYAPTGIRIALQGYSPTQVALLRFAIASLVLLGMALGRNIARIRPADLPWIATLALFGVAGHHVALNFGQRGVSAAAASCLAQTVPIFTALLARPVLGEIVALRHWACVVVGACGAILIVKGDQDVSGSWAGGALVLLAALSWGIYFTLQRRTSRRMDGLSVSCYTVWLGTAMLLPIGLPGLRTGLAQATTGANLALVLLGIFPSALAYMAWNHVLRHREASRASLWLFLIPPVAMLIAVPALHETPSPMLLAGAGLIACSVLLLPGNPGAQAQQACVRPAPIGSLAARLRRTRPPAPRRRRDGRTGPP
jgi:drug/metabolite transporter (DMT)-like permease